MAERRKEIAEALFESAPRAASELFPHPWKTRSVTVQDLEPYVNQRLKSKSGDTLGSAEMLRFLETQDKDLGLAGSTSSLSSIPDVSGLATFWDFLEGIRQKGKQLPPVCCVGGGVPACLSPERDR